MLILSAILVFFIASAAWVSNSLPIAILLLGAVLLAYHVPKFSYYSFFLILPVFGHKPGTWQTAFLLYLSGALLIGSCLRNLVKQDCTTRSANSTLINSYLLISSLSLLGLPLKDLLFDLKSKFPPLGSFALIPFSLTRLATATEELIYYPLLALVLLFLAVLIERNSHQFLTAKERAQALALGLLFTIILGFLGYYGMIPLQELRGLDPTVNAGGVEFRMQSLFGHSGWFAEYVTLTIPCILLILLIPKTYWLRITLILVAALIGELTLVMTYQRGGWLSYPLTLFIIWGMIYLVRCHEQGEANALCALKKSFLKIMLSFPLTLVITAGVLHLSGLDLGAYKSRALEISKTSDRTDFVRAGVMLGMLRPMLGLGGESFAYQFEKEFVAKSGTYFKSIDLPLHGTAHNVYAQTFAGKGLLGLLALILIALKPLQLLLQSIKTNQQLEQIILNAIAACSGIAFLIYGNVQEIFYIPALGFIFFILIGLTSGVTSSQAEQHSRKALSIYAAILIVGALHHYLPPVSGLTQPEVGCYPPEANGARWCGRRALVRLDGLVAKRELEVSAGPYHGATQTLIIEDPTGQQLWAEALAPNTSTKIALDTLRKKIEYFVIKFDGVFVPQVSIPDSTDIRLLAVRVK
ncbi:O-antigen ligase family protein [bacterium]|nr:O-antigen ligase family protein [bacterium]